MSEKIQKVLANLGYGSRREIERWIVDERISVNQKTATLGDRITAKDQVCIDGKPIKKTIAAATARVILYHKPAGEICTRKDPEGRKTVFQALPKIKQGRWVSVGRLDLNTSGLLLFTNDGALAHQLMHPSQHIEREYAVRILGTLDQKKMRQLTQGMRLEDGMARFEHIVDSGGEGANHWYHVVIMEGRNRLVRRLIESQNVTVSRLMRVRFGPIFLDKSLSPGRWQELSSEQIQQLKNGGTKPS